ncbi:MAG: radical SAM protein [Firmicutes bacterium]|nr:radical SAM protein [Bacillota bacterium]
MKYEYDNINKLNAIEVTLSMGCRVDCHYCPQSLLLHNYFSDNKNRLSMMRFHDFTKLLENVKHGGTICFSGMCEPFLNPECDDMILYAYEKGFRITLLTTLIGFNKESLEKLRHVKFDEITLHIPDKEGNSKFDITAEYLENLRAFHDTFPVTSYSCHGDIHPAVQMYLDGNGAFSNAMMNRAGNLDCGQVSNPRGEIVCMVGTIGGYGNWTPEILPDGTMLLCCMDYGMKHVLGNLLTMNVKDILEGAELRKIHEGMKEEHLEILCRKCSGAMEIQRTPAYQFKNTKERFLKDGTAEDRQKHILQLFSESKDICVFGLGKLFWDNFFSHRWNDVLGQTCFCDNAEELWGKDIFGVPCISPDELKDLKQPLVITHMANDKAVRQQLEEMGITKIVNVKKLQELF